MKGVAFCDYDNYHAFSIFEHLDLDIKKYHFLNPPDWRKGKKWESKRSLKSRFFNLRMWKDIIRSDYAIFWGIFAPFPSMFLIFLFSCIFNKKVFLCSEGFKFQKKGWSLILVKFLIFFVRQSKLSILCIGDKADLDYKSIGFDKAIYLKFGFFENYNALVYDEEKLKNKYNLVGQSENPLRVLFVGQIIERKGIKQLIESYQDIDRHVVFDIAGEGELTDSLIELSNKLSGRITINIHGHCEDEALDNLFKIAHIFVLPSSYEGWGVVVNQALNASLPIFLSEGVRSGPGFLFSGGNGYIFTSYQDFFNCISVVTEEKLKDMSKESYEHSKNWNIKSVSQAMLSYIEEGVIQDEGPFSKI